MWKIYKRFIHSNFVCSTSQSSQLLVDSTKVSFKVYKYLDEKMPTRQNDYLINVAKIFPFIMNTKLYQSIFGLNKLLFEEKISKHDLHCEIWDKFDNVLNSDILELGHFDLAYRMANPLFCLEEIDLIDNYDITSTFGNIQNFGHYYIFNISINNEIKDNQENLKNIEKITAKSNVNSNIAAFELLKNEKVQKIAFDLKPITNEYIIDIAESKLFNNYPDFGDHNVGIDRQVIIPIDNSLISNSDFSNNKIKLGIQLLGGDITNYESIKYLSKFFLILFFFYIC